MLVSDEKSLSSFVLHDSLSLIRTEQGHNNSQAMFLDVASGMRTKNMARRVGQWLQLYCGRMGACSNVKRALQ
jgi:hypothetical protein